MVITSTLPPIKFKTLLVDDDPIALDELSEGLQALGFPVSTCLSAHEALAQIAVDPDIRVLVTDLVMPGMDGSRLVSQVASKDQSSIACVVLTAHATTERAVHAIRNRAVDFLHKPVTPEEVAASIRRAALTVEKSVESRSVSRALVWPRGPDAGPTCDVTDLLAQIEDRNAVFGAQSFGNRKWELLLALAVAPKDRPVSLRELESASKGGARALRAALAELKSFGLVEYVKLPDRRRRAVRLTPNGYDRLERLIARLRSRCVA